MLQKIKSLTGIRVLSLLIIFIIYYNLWLNSKATGSNSITSVHQCLKAVLLLFTYLQHQTFQTTLQGLPLFLSNIHTSPSSFPTTSQPSPINISSSNLFPLPVILHVSIILPHLLHLHYSVFLFSLINQHSGLKS